MTRRLLAVLVLATWPAIVGCASTGPQAGDEEFQAGLQRAEKGDVQGAVKALEEGVQQYPNHLRMRFGLARLQYENGEKLHLEELNARLAASKLEEENRKGDASKYLREANDLHSKASPHYRAARENLKTVAQKTGDDIRAGWAYFLLMRCDVFFEDWDQGAEHLEKAIDKGKPTGSLLAQWQEFQRQLKREVERRKRGKQTS
jgi:tetratricopeptide (TPR) repeat protein